MMILNLMIMKEKSFQVELMRKKNRNATLCLLVKWLNIKKDHLSKMNVFLLS